MTVISRPIFECRNDACRRPRSLDTARNPDGRREWNPRVLMTPDPDHPGFDEIEPVDGLHTFNCPDCGARGTWVPA